jgi:hypothetical protein
VTAVRVSYYDERGDEIDTIEITGADRGAIPLDAQHLRVRADPARLTRIIREAVESHEAGAEQWYADGLAVDCDAVTFWQVVEQALRGSP